MREKYLKFTAQLGMRLRKIYGRFWWYSLIHEKNTIISNTYDNLVHNVSEIKLNYIDAIYLAIRKYIGFIFRYFYFFKFVKIKEDEILFTYYGKFFNSLKTDYNRYIYIPQKEDYRQIKKENEIVIDNFISFSDFIYVAFMYIKFLFNFKEKIIKACFCYYAYINNLPRLSIYNASRDDVYRSFIGDVMIEGLFYDRIFRRISKKIKPKKVIYVFEGRNWEKALCEYFKCIKIGIICSAVSKNNLQFFYHNIDIELMPLPDYLGVPGVILEKVFKKIYENVFVIGTDRYSFTINSILNNSKIEKKEILAILGANDKQNIALLDFIGKSGLKDVRVKIHPSSKLTKDFIFFHWYNLVESKIKLFDKKCIIAASSGVCLEALLYGAPVIVPELNFIDYIPIDDVYKGQRFCYRVNNFDELHSAIKDIESMQLDHNICNEYVSNYFVFKTKEEKRKIIEELK